MQLKNRVVMAPMGTRYPSFSGTVTQRLIDYYVERARGGVGLIIVHFASISQEGISSLYPLGIWDDSFVPGLRDLVRAVHGGRRQGGHPACPCGRTDQLRLHPAPAGRALRRCPGSAARHRES